MEHFKSLDKFRYNGLPLIRLPWLGFNHQTGPAEDFVQYPLKHGWTTHELAALRTCSNLHELRTTAISTVAMLQSWLFVGAIESCLDVGLTATDFVIVSKEGELVSTAFLPTVIQKWQLSARQSSPDERVREVAQFKSVLSEIQFWCFRLSVFSSSVNASWDWNGNIRNWSSDSWKDYEMNLDLTARLATLVGEALNTAIRGLDLDGHIITYPGFRGHYTPRSQNHVSARLVRCGWCPFMVRVLFTYASSIAEYAVFFPWEGQRYAHLHKHCSQAVCVGYNVDTTKYETRHVRQSCSCSHVKPSVKDVKRILCEQTGIPLMKILVQSSTPSSENCTRGTHIAEHSSLIVQDTASLSANEGYIAISHVWSDGMGSTTERGLPMCLLTELFSSIKVLGYQHIWIDSLCVPEDEQARRVAIQRMAATYQNASATLVIDRTITSLPYDQIQDEFDNLLLRLVFAPWMLRLWTLQEALLSRAIFFRFKDRVTSLSEINARASLRRTEDLNTVTEVLVRALQQLLHLHVQARQSRQRLNLGHIQQLLRIRNTSHASDETLAITGLIAETTADLLKAPVARSMQQFLRQIKWLPPEIILVDGLRLEEYGWRWAIQSFLSNNSKGTAADSFFPLPAAQIRQTAECLDGAGLLARYWTIHLNDVVELDKTRRILIQLPDLLIRVGASLREKEEIFTFDAIALCTPLSEMIDIRVGAAMLSTDSRWTGSQPIYAYCRRMLIRTLDSEAYSNELGEKVMVGSYGDRNAAREIVIV